MISALKEIERIIINETQVKRVSFFDMEGDGLRAVLDHGDLTRMDRSMPADVLSCDIGITFIDDKANWQKVITAAFAMVAFLQGSKDYKWIDDGITREELDNEYAVKVRLKVFHHLR